MTSRDIDQLTDALRRAHPGIVIEQRRDAALAEVDDTGAWHVRHPDGFADVQILTGTGNVPFTVASDFAAPTVVKSVDAARKLVVQRLGLGISA